MSDWYHLRHRKPVPYKHTIMVNPLGFAIENRRHFTKERRIRNKYFGKVQVSTIFLGLDHSHCDNEPVLFETMILGMDNDEYQTRCHTHREALAMHKQALRVVKHKLSVRKYNAQNKKQQVPSLRPQIGLGNFATR